MILPSYNSLAKNLVLWPHLDAKEVGGEQGRVIVSSKAATIFFISGFF